MVAAGLVSTGGLASAATVVLGGSGVLLVSIMVLIFWMMAASFKLFGIMPLTMIFGIAQIPVLTKHAPKSETEAAE